jgi:hypothetical protein
LSTGLSARLPRISYGFARTRLSTFHSSIHLHRCASPKKCASCLTPLPVSAVPAGLESFRHSSPALKRRAIVGCPSGTGIPRLWLCPAAHLAGNNKPTGKGRMIRLGWRVGLPWAFAQVPMRRMILPLPVLPLGEPASGSPTARRGEGSTPELTSRENQIPPEQLQISMISGRSASFASRTMIILIILYQRSTSASCGTTFRRRSRSAANAKQA